MLAVTLYIEQNQRFPDSLSPFPWPDASGAFHDFASQIGAGGTGGTTGANAGNVGGDTYFCNSTSNCATIAGTAVQVGAIALQKRNDERWKIAKLTGRLPVDATAQRLFSNKAHYLKVVLIVARNAGQDRFL